MGYKKAPAKRETFGLPASQGGQCAIRCYKRMGEEGQTIPRKPATGNETVLLVDDEEGVRDLVKRILRRRGYSVLEARHEEEALCLCRQHPNTIDLLLTDVVLPGLSGHELAQRLTALRPGMKVLYMSGYHDDAGAGSEASATPSAFLQKPFSGEGLAGKVREVLDSSGS